VTREPFLLPHPPEKPAPPRAQAAKQIAVVCLGQTKLLGTFYIHSESEARNAVEMKSLGQFKKITITLSTKISQQIYRVVEQFLRPSRRRWVAHNCEPAFCSGEKEISGGRFLLTLQSSDDRIVCIDNRLVLQTLTLRLPQYLTPQLMGD
jgi:hypothetical protein